MAWVITKIREGKGFGRQNLRTFAADEADDECEMGG